MKKRIIHPKEVLLFKQPKLNKRYRDLNIIVKIVRKYNRFFNNNIKVLRIAKVPLL